MTIKPYQIVWRGPQGYLVILDEDGVSLRCAATTLEERETDVLLDLISEAKRRRDVGSSPTPTIPDLPF